MLAQPLQATTNGTPLPHVISVSYGVCESTVSAYTASRTLAERQLAADGGARHHHRRRRRRHRLLGLRARRAGEQAHLGRQEGAGLLAGELALGARRGRHEPHAERRQHDRLHRRWNDTTYPAPFTKAAGGGGGLSTFNKRPVVAARAVVHELEQADGPRRRRVRRREPGLPDRLLQGREELHRARARASRSSAARARRRRWSPA